jgi:hypothetical protein
MKIPDRPDSAKSADKSNASDEGFDNSRFDHPHSRRHDQGAAKESDVWKQRGHDDVRDEHGCEH